MKEIYPGARDFWSIFWAIVVAASSMGFLIVGISIGLGTAIVDWTPVTAALIGFLRPPPEALWWPQGVAMSFYGFFGFFLVAPWQWYLVIKNKGRGIAEFNRETRRFAIVRDEELIVDVDFDEIDCVKLEYCSMFWGGSREVYIILKDGKPVKFMEYEDELPRRVLEKRAAILSDFLGKDLQVDFY